MLPFLEKIYIIHSMLEAQSKNLHFQSGEYFLFHVNFYFSFLHETNTAFRAKEMETLKCRKKVCNWNYENIDGMTKSPQLLNTSSMN